MTKSLFIAVVNNESDDEIYMHTYFSEGSILSSVADLEPHESIERIFRVDEYGNVTHYEVAFKGRLYLKEVGK